MKVAPFLANEWWYETNNGFGNESTKLWYNISMNLNHHLQDHVYNTQELGGSNHKSVIDDSRFLIKSTNAKNLYNTINFSIMLRSSVHRKCWNGTKVLNVPLIAQTLLVIKIGKHSDMTLVRIMRTQII